MKKIILISLLVLFGCDDDTVSSNEVSKTPISWYINGTNQCNYTNEEDICAGYGVLLLSAYKWGSLSITNYNDAGYYVVERCDCIDFYENSVADGGWIDTGTSNCASQLVGSCTQISVSYIGY